MLEIGRGHQIRAVELRTKLLALIPASEVAGGEDHADDPASEMPAMMTRVQVEERPGAAGSE